jgi:hypothetical protein
LRVLHPERRGRFVLPFRRPRAALSPLHLSFLRLSSCHSHSFILVIPAPALAGVNSGGNRDYKP